MATPKNPKDQIITGAIAHLNAHGPPFASYADIAGEAKISRQLMRYYFPEPDTLMFEVSERLAEAYRKALAKGAEALEGRERLAYILDFYFALNDTPAQQHGCNDALTAYSAGHEDIRKNLRSKIVLIGQALQLEIKGSYPELSLRTCAETAYVCLCIMQGNRKATGSLGLASNHSIIARRAIDRVLDNAHNDTAPLSEGFEVWS